MEKIDCRGGHTQIGKILAHAKRENEAKKCRRWSSSAMPWRSRSTISAPRPANWACSASRRSCFQEGGDAVAEQAFREIARLSRGAYCRFDISAAHELAELLRAVAAYAAGGMKALADLKARHNSGAVKLLAQLR